MVDNYGIPGLAEAVWERASRVAGEGPVEVEHLALFDQLHMGGRFATARVVAALGVTSDDRVLDVGSGLGGPARQLARHTAAQVVGIDLTPQHVAAATELSGRVGLGERTRFLAGDATATPDTTPAADGHYTAAMMLFVGMNIADKASLFAAVRRWLRPGAPFAVYDPMLRGTLQPRFPVPWAADPADSFLASVERYRELLAEAGLEVESEQDLTPAVRELAAAQQAGEVPGQLQLMLERQGEEGRTRLDNIARAIRERVVVPQLLLTRAR